MVSDGRSRVNFGSSGSCSRNYNSSVGSRHQNSIAIVDQCSNIKVGILKLVRKAVERRVGIQEVSIGRVLVVSKVRFLVVVVVVVPVAERLLPPRLSFASTLSHGFNVVVLVITSIQGSSASANRCRTTDACRSWIVTTISKDLLELLEDLWWQNGLQYLKPLGPLGTSTI